MASSNPATPATVKKQPQYTVEMFGYYVPYWLIVFIVIIMLAILHRMNVINMYYMMPTTTRYVSTQQGGGINSELSPASALLPNLNSAEFM